MAPRTAAVGDDWTSLSGRQRKAFTAKLLELYGPRCCICNQIINEGDESCEHIKPRSRGGKTTLDNCRPAHLSCNVAKGNREIGSTVKTVNGVPFFLSTRAGPPRA